jgi:hypothetical protein
MSAIAETQLIDAWYQAMKPIVQRPDVQGLAVDLAQLCGVSPGDHLIKTTVVRLIFMESTGLTHFDGVENILHWLKERIHTLGCKATMKPKRGLRDGFTFERKPLPHDKAREFVASYVSHLWAERKPRC